MPLRDPTPDSFVEDVVENAVVVRSSLSYWYAATPPEPEGLPPG